MCFSKDFSKDSLRTGSFTSCFLAQPDKFCSMKQGILLRCLCHCQLPCTSKQGVLLVCTSCRATLGCNMWNIKHGLNVCANAACHVQHACQLSTLQAQPPPALQIRVHKSQMHACLAVTHLEAQACILNPWGMLASGPMCGTSYWKLHF